MKKKKISKRIINYITTIFMLISFYIVIAAIITTNQSGVPIVFNHSFLIVQTESMKPTIQPNDLIISRQDSFSSIKKDDIIIFICIEEGSRVYGQAIAHRVVEIVEYDANNNPVSLRTQGDNNNTYDKQLVTKSNYRGKVVGINSSIGVFLASLTDGTGMIFILIFVLLASIILLEIKNIQQIRLQAKREKFLKEREELKQAILQEYQALSDEANNKVMVNDSAINAKEKKKGKKK